MPMSTIATPVARNIVSLQEQNAVTTARASASPAVRWTGRILTGLPVFFLLFDSVIKIMQIAPVIESFGQLGYPVDLARPIGIIQLACLLVYVVPRTSVLGAVLLTGYLGGAVATHVRIGSPLASHTLFPIYIGALLWGALLLRDERLRAIVTGRR
jgi:hypothetical protein